MADQAADISGSFVSFLTTVLIELFTSPLNVILLIACVVLIYKIFKSSYGSSGGKAPVEPPLKKMKRQDMTLEQLGQYDGTNSEGRVCVAVNGKVFDVTRGKKFYGPGGPYAAFAGHDATRALATFSVNDVKQEYDDLSDLSSMQMDSVREWEIQFTEKYEYVGKLLKPGEHATEYSDDEEGKEGKESKSKKDD